MHRVLRYCCSIAVALAVTAVVAGVATSDHILLFVIPPLYGLTTSFAIAHWRAWTRYSSRGGARGAKIRNGLVGGVLGGSGVLLLSTVSVSVWVVAVGFLLLGHVNTVVEFDHELDDRSSPEQPSDDEAESPSIQTS
ncbi:hypothetical protein GOC74_05905 [Halomicrobium mukohataei]|uniref:DUF8153 domain-containing protein n=1 Tax=Halomicrobium mukohataei TaxID=57705 RepID=A0A847U8Y5_9EURY|nr:hypothetical protein [Halomicrobium mukohataei]NLV09459.1 hypothetical protein [Halomicrobium mukohataei]